MQPTIYKEQLDASVYFIGSAISDLYERFQDQRTRLEALRAKRKEKGSDVTSEEEERLESHVIGLERRVNEYGDLLESAIRVQIDRKVELEDNARIMAEVRDTTAANAPSSQHDLPDADAEDGAETQEWKRDPAPSMVERFQALRSQKESDYEALSMQQRYAQNNDYAAFKKLWHDALVGEGGPPLPDSSRWFRPDGRPVMRMETADGDDELTVSREILSIKCPLTLLPMKEPYTNNKCKHTVEKAAMINYLTDLGRPCQCPQLGCREVSPPRSLRFWRSARRKLTDRLTLIAQKYSLATFNDEFFPDLAMERRIRRVQQGKELEMDIDDVL
ncbi:hypothetical protein ACJ41O_009712 [Fusarium nematophilum]